MYSLSIAFSFISVFCLYSASERVTIEKKGIVLWLYDHGSLACSLAGLFFSLSIVLLVREIGLAAGIFSGLSLWMLTAALTVVFVPFQKVRKLHLVVLILAFLLLEISTA